MGTAPNARALVCPNCGGSIELRGFGRTLSAVCVQCLSILDTQSPELTVLQQFQVKERVLPLIPLGKRGKLHGDPWEVIGFQCRQILVELIPYEWREYVLFNPYKGFRYLTEYDGHWNDVKPITGVPEETTKSGKKAVKWMNETFTHFQSARAETTYVMGEFPWQVRVGETAMCDDYVSPPRMLSSEKTDIETSWSLGEYISGKQVWQAFALPDSPPPAKGIYANEPSPYTGGVGSVWTVCLVLVVALFLMLSAASVMMQQKKVIEQNYTFTPGSPGEASFVTQPFSLDGRPTNVEIDIKTDLDNQWAFFNLALINEETGQGYDVGREVSYYHGVDSDGGWTEGDKNDSVLLPTVPPGRYYLRVEPDVEVAPGAPAPPTVRYAISLRRDVPYNIPFAIAFVLLLIPPVLRTFQSISFESRRWKESDYSGGSSDDDSGGSDDD